MLRTFSGLEVFASTSGEFALDAQHYLGSLIELGADIAAQPVLPCVTAQRDGI